MQLNTEDIVIILKLYEESNFDFLQLECGDVKLVVTSNGCSLDQVVSGQPNSSMTGLAQALRVAPEETKKVIEQSPNQNTVSKTEVTGDIEIEEGLVAIKAPMVGTFYSRPEPGAEPFVGVGSKVNEDSAVGTIEVMKVFSSVVSNVKGVITKILVEDSQFVEYGQPLFLVRPEGE